MLSVLAESIKLTVMNLHLSWPQVKCTTTPSQISNWHTRCTATKHVNWRHMENTQQFNKTPS